MMENTSNGLAGERTEKLPRDEQLIKAHTIGARNPIKADIIIAMLVVMGKDCVECIREIGVLHLLLEVGIQNIEGTEWQGCDLPPGARWGRLRARSLALMSMALSMGRMAEWEMFRV